MARAIDADAFMKEIRKWLGNETDFRALQEIIAGMPTIDPVKHGEWVVTHLPDVFQCDYCKKATKMDELCDSEILRAYCPNCGARMDGDINGKSD